MSARPDPFLQAHADAQNAVATFLPSLGPPQPPPPPPPHPLAKTNLLQVAVHAAAMARHVEGISANAALGKPVAPPNPPSPQEQFPPSIDQVHIRAIAAAINAHPEIERAQLLHEATLNLTKWIAGKSGTIVNDGHVEIAGGPEAAEKLAAKIVNKAVDDHDQRQQAKKDALQNDNRASGNETESKGGSRGNSASDKGRSLARNGERSPGASVSGNGAHFDSGHGMGELDPESGRPITQSATDLSEAQDQATAAAPELEAKLGQVEDSVPGAEVDGIRDEKDPDRAQEKVDGDGKPVNTLTDLVAGRIAVDSPEAKYAAVSALKDQSPVINEEDNFKDGDPDYGFRAHTLQIPLSGGKTSAEVQIVPKEIAAVADKTHDTYEAGRDAEMSGDDAQAAHAKAENKAAHDEAMDKFNDRNSERPDRIVKALQDAGFKVRGTPIKIGGHSFVPVVDDDAT